MPLRRREWTNEYGSWLESMGHWKKSFLYMNRQYNLRRWLWTSAINATQRLVLQFKPPYWPSSSDRQNLAGGSYNHLGLQKIQGTASASVGSWSQFVFQLVYVKLQLLKYHRHSREGTILSLHAVHWLTVAMSQRRKFGACVRQRGRKENIQFDLIAICMVM